MPWALAWAKDTFRYVGHCGLVFEEFRFFGPWDFTFRLFGPWGLDVGILLVGSLRFFYLISVERTVDTVWSLVFPIFLLV